MRPGKDLARPVHAGASTRVDCVVRSAGLQDGRLLASLGERSFREAWGAFNDPADMDEYCAAHFSVPGTVDDLGRASVRFLVAEAGNEPVGYLRTEVGAAPACVRGTAPAELSRVYVLRRWHGRGVAHALMSAALASLAAAGRDVAWLAVWQRADRAQAFYCKWGFEAVGTTTFRLGRDLQDDFVMQRPLTSVGPAASPSP